MSNEEMEKSLWSLANSITGFAVAKDVALGYALIEKPLPLTRWSDDILIPAALMVAVLCAANCIAVLCCKKHALALRAPQPQENPKEDPITACWRQSTWGRVIAIILFDVCTGVSAVL